MIVIAQLKTDKAPREYSFTGHGENDPEKVKALFESTHPGSKFESIKTPGLDRATGRVYVEGNAPEYAAVSHTINAHDAGLVPAEKKEAAAQ
jgi:hypothetical protein